MLASLQQIYPGVTLRLERAVGEAESVIAAMATYALAVTGAAGVDIA
jgi:hypothetical protein